MFQNKKIFNAVIISSLIFLFILFFQPFSIEGFEFNNKVLLILGLSAITFTTIILFDILLPAISPKWFKMSIWEVGPGYLASFLIFLINSTAYPFFLQYVGGLTITFSLMLKVVIISSFPIIFFRVYDTIISLQTQIIELQESNKKYLRQIREDEDVLKSKFIQIFSENKTEELAVYSDRLVLIKSANNYIEVIVKESDSLKKTLIRNTLRNIENQLSDCYNFIRCHRTCIVNTSYVDKLHRDFSGYKLQIREYNEEIPVSRQYLLNVKHVLDLE